MNNTLQKLIKAISLIPRQFYSNSSDDCTSELVHQRFISQLIVRYKKLTGINAQPEIISPACKMIQEFTSTPDKKAIVHKLVTGIPSTNDLKPSLFTENPATPPFSQATFIELSTESKLKRAIFYWSFFKLHLLADLNRNSCCVYCIINIEEISIQKKITAYYERGFYSSFNTENIFFLIKKNYSSKIVVLNYKGEIHNICDAEI